MRLTQWTDYSLRVLMYCAAAGEREQLPTVAEIAQAHGISRHHLSKVVVTLAGMGYLETVRGRHGGLRLLQPAEHIVLGELIRRTETDLDLVECLDPTRNTCLLDGRCQLKVELTRALASFLAVLDGVTLRDIVDAPSTRSGWEHLDAHARPR